MEVLLIDIGALAAFLAYVAIVYWHGISHDSRAAQRGRTGSGRSRASWPAAAAEVSQLECASARARSARSSVRIAQRSSQLLQ
jgi:hypothetical protein